MSAATHERPHVPVAWKHQQAEIRAALRRHSVRPVTKSCMMNSQRLFVAADELRGRLVYVEGWRADHQLDVPIPHAWLELDGVLVDLTLDASAGRYRATARPGLEEVARFVCATNTYEFVSDVGGA